MANSTSLPCDSAASRPNMAFPLTPPASIDQHETFNFDANKWIQFLHTSLEAYRHAPVPHSRTAQFELPPRHYTQAVAELERMPLLRGIIEDKVQLDYDPDPGLIHFRMPAPAHDVFTTFVENEINKLIEQVAELDDKDATFAAGIISSGSSRIILQTTEKKDPEGPRAALQRHPDTQFQHLDAVFPGVVVEVSYSQDGKDLKKLAWDYIQHSNGDIKAVIGIDINHETKPSTVSLWQPEYTREAGEDLDTLGVHAEIEYLPFRSSAQRPVNHTQNLRLALSDFATDSLTEGLSNRSLCIRFDRLAELLGKAERVQAVREQRSGGGVKSARTLKKRQRSSSPADRLLSDDESRFRAQERTAVDRAAAEDEDFQPPSKRRA